MTREASEETRLVSYSQNGEDVMLARAFRDLDRGFYVDVGAAWPRTDSVTKHFYDLGWSGINVEPNPALLAELRRERPRDVNLGVGVSDRAGTADFFVVDGTGLSTLDPELAARHEAGGYSVERIEIEVERLADLLEAHRPDGEIHFLKLDVEGAEADVIRSNDWSRFRPWIVVVEVVTASEPGPESEPPSFEHALEAQGYRAVYRDGINVFYLAQEHAELAPAFATPLNILDRYVPVEVVDLAATAARLEQHIAWLGEQHEQQVAQLEHQHRERIAVSEAEHRSVVEGMELTVDRLELTVDRLEKSLDEATLDAWRQAARVREAETEIERLRNDVSSARAAEAQRVAAVEQANAELRRLTSSQSWRLTRPLRVVLSLRLAPRATTRYLLHRATGGRVEAVRVRPTGPTSTVAPVSVPDRGALATTARDFLSVVDGAIDGRSE